jgi:hypothetical protein
MRALLIAAAAAALLTCAATAKEVARGGDLLPYESAEVVQYEVLGGLTVYVESEPAGGWDLLSAGLFALLALASGMGWWRLRSGSDGSPSVAAARVLRGFALVAAALALDEALAFHETVGHNVRFLTALPGVERPDDAIVVLGALLLGGAVLAAWRVLARVPAALAVLALAGVVGLTAALGDPLGFAYEEQFEVVSAGLVLVAALLLSRGLPAESSSASTASSSDSSTLASSFRANSAGELRSSGRSVRRRVSGDAPPVQRM